MQDEASRIEAEVQKRLALLMAEQQQKFAAMMQQAISEALAGVERSSDALDRERQRLQAELDAAQALRAKAEREGEAMATEAFEKHRREYEEAIRIAILRDLTRLHIEGGKTTAEIMKWLAVTRSFVDKIREVVDRVNGRRSAENAATRLAGNPRVRIVDEGRFGVIYFESEVGSFDMWWEMCYDALAIVAVPSLDQWETKTGMPQATRMEVLNFIGQEIVRQKTDEGMFIVGDSVLTVYARGPTEVGGR